MKGKRATVEHAQQVALPSDPQLITGELLPARIMHKMLCTGSSSCITRLRRHARNGGYATGITSGVHRSNMQIHKIKGRSAVVVSQWRLRPTPLPTPVLQTTTLPRTQRDRCNATLLPLSVTHISPEGREGGVKRQQKNGETGPFILKSLVSHLVC